MTNLSIKKEVLNPILKANNLTTVNKTVKLYKISTRTQLSFSDIISIETFKTFVEENQIDKEVIAQVEIHLKYSGYIDNEKKN